jgi:hypothetical protein
LVSPLLIAGVWASFRKDDTKPIMNEMHLMIMRIDQMTSENKCNVKDDLVNQLIALNNKLNTLSPGLLHSEQARAEVQERRESLYVEIKRHRAKGHEGKPCPAVQRQTYSSNIK